MYYLPTEHNPFLNDWMKQKGDNYAFRDSQNKMMKVMALKLQQKFALS